MTDANKPTGPDEKPVVAGSDEIEQLLAQAEKLAEELVEGTGAAREGGEAASDGAQRVVADEAILSATADVEVKLTEVEAALGSDGGEADASRAVSEAGAVAAEATVSASGDLEGGGAAASNGGESPVAGDEDAAAETTIGGGEAAVEGGEGGTPGVAESKAETKIETPKPQKRSALARVLSIVRFCCAAVPAAMKMIPRSLGYVVTTIDRPFAGLSPAAKQCIGFAAIATLLIGIASLFLPPLFNRNPYILPKPAPAEAEGGAKGEGEAKPEGGGHGEEAKHEAPAAHH